MLALARATGDPAVRAAVYGALAGLTDARLRSPLLDSLASDASPLVRAAAAGALRSLRSDPDVHTALERGLAGDADEHVKDVAFLSLDDQPRRAPEPDEGR